MSIETDVPSFGYLVIFIKDLIVQRLMSRITCFSPLRPTHAQTQFVYQLIMGNTISMTAQSKKYYYEKLWGSERKLLCKM